MRLDPKSNALLLLVLAITLLISALIQLPRLNDPNSVQDDFRKFYWMHRFDDPDLFPEDTGLPRTLRSVSVGEFEVSIDILSPLYSLLFFFGSRFIPIITLNKLILFPLILVSAYFLFRIGEMVKGAGAGFALALSYAVINMGSPASTTMAVGLQRSFMAPLLIVLVYALMRRRIWVAALFAGLGGLVYPPIALIGLITYILTAFELERRPLRLKIKSSRLLPLMVFAGLALIIMLPAFFWQLGRADFSVSQLATRLQEFLESPDFLEGGRYYLFDPSLSPFVGRAGLVTFPGTFWVLTGLVLLSASIFLIRPVTWHAYPEAFKALFAASFISFALAWLGVFFAASFVLYLPSRYGRVSLILVLLAYIIVNLESAIRIGIAKYGQLGLRVRYLLLILFAGVYATVIFLINNQAIPFLESARDLKLSWLLALSAGSLVSSAVLAFATRGSKGLSADAKIWSPKTVHWLAIGIALFLLNWSYFDMAANSHAFLKTDAPTQALMSHIQTTPPESRIMGPPCQMSSVPILAKRSVLWSCERLGSERMILDTLEAYFAENLVDVYKFCQAYDVDFLVADNASFSGVAQSQGWISFEPYRSILGAKLGQQDKFALSQLPDDVTIPREAGRAVLPCWPDQAASSARDSAVKDAGAQMAYASVEPAMIRQGASAEINIFWRDLASGPEERELCIGLKEGPDLLSQSRCFTAFTENDIRKLQGSTYAFMTYEFPVSPYLDAGRYQVVAELQVPSSESVSEAALLLGEIVYDAKMRSFAEGEARNPRKWSASWDNQIALLDYEVSEDPGEKIQISLHWLALTRMSNSYKVFVHLTEPMASTPTRQVDSVPQNWTYPTNWWEVGEIVSDTLTIQVDGSISGSYELWLGFYNADSLARLPIDRAGGQGNPTYQDALKLADFEW